MEFLVSVEIAAPPDVVWSVMSDPEHWHEWTASVRSIRLLGNGPFRPGRRALVRQPRLPPAVWTVTAVDPGRSFTWKSGLPGMWVYGHHAVEPVSGGTRAILSLRFEGMLGGLLARTTAGINDRYLVPWIRDF
jgi:uncharacterized protein YndB with AHSA1/START domain